MLDKVYKIQGWIKNMEDQTFRIGSASPTVLLANLESFDKDLERLVHGEVEDRLGDLMPPHSFIIQLRCKKPEPQLVNQIADYLSLRGYSVDIRGDEITFREEGNIAHKINVSYDERKSLLWISGYTPDRRRIPRG